MRAAFVSRTKKQQFSGQVFRVKEQEDQVLRSRPMQLKHWQASGQPQSRSRKTPKVARRHKRRLARLAQQLRKPSR